MPAPSSCHVVTHRPPVVLGIARQFQKYFHTPSHKSIICFLLQPRHMLFKWVGVGPVPPEKGPQHLVESWSLLVRTTKIVHPLNIAMGSPNLKKPQWMVHIAEYCWFEQTIILSRLFLNYTQLLGMDQLVYEFDTTEFDSYTHGCFIPLILCTTSRKPMSSSFLLVKSHFVDGQIFISVLVKSSFWQDNIY
jgi:hypothetical protein